MILQNMAMQIGKVILHQKKLPVMPMIILWNFEASKARETITSVIQELCKLLAEDGSEECKEWLYQIADELGLIDMDYQDYLDTDEWLKEFM